MEIIKLNARSRDSAETTIRYHLGQIEDRESEETSSVATATEELSEMSTGRGGGTSTLCRRRAERVWAAVAQTPSKTQNL